MKGNVPVVLILNAVRIQLKHIRGTHTEVILTLEKV